MEILVPCTYLERLFVQTQDSENKILCPEYYLFILILSGQIQFL